MISRGMCLHPSQITYPSAGKVEHLDDEQLLTFDVKHRQIDGEFLVDTVAVRCDHPRRGRQSIEEGYARQVRHHGQAAAGDSVGGITFTDGLHDTRDPLSGESETKRGALQKHAGTEGDGVESTSGSRFDGLGKAQIETILSEGQLDPADALFVIPQHGCEAQVNTCVRPAHDPYRFHRCRRRRAQLHRVKPRVAADELRPEVEGELLDDTGLDAEGWMHLGEDLVDEGRPEAQLQRRDLRSPQGFVGDESHTNQRIAAWCRRAEGLTGRDVRFAPIAPVGPWYFLDDRFGTDTLRNAFPEILGDLATGDGEVVGNLDNLVPCPCCDLDAGTGEGFPVPVDGRHHPLLAETDKRRGHLHVGDETLPVGLDLGQVALFLLDTGELQTAHFNEANLLRGEGLLHMLVLRPVAPLGERRPDEIAAGIQSAIGDTHLVHLGRGLRRQQLEPVQPVAGPQVDTDLIAVTKLVVRPHGKPGAEQPIGEGLKKEEVEAAGVGIAHDVALGHTHDVLAEGDDLYLGQTGSFVTVPPNGAAQVDGQSLPDVLGHMQLSAACRGPEVVDSASLRLGQRVVLGRRDLLCPWPVCIENIEADELSDLAFDTVGHRPLRHDVEAEGALVLVRPIHQADTEEGLLVVEVRQPVRDQYSEPEEGIAHHFIDEPQFDTGDDECPTEIDFGKPIVEADIPVWLPEGRRITVDQIESRVPVRPGGTDAALGDDLLILQQRVAELGGVCRRVELIHQSARADGTAGIDDAHTGLRLPGLPVGSCVDQNSGAEKPVAVCRLRRCGTGGEPDQQGDGPAERACCIPVTTWGHGEPVLALVGTRVMKVRRATARKGSRMAEGPRRR